MKAAIMGAGAMGTVLGAFLTRNGFPVDLIDSYPAQVDALNEKGRRCWLCRADCPGPCTAAGADGRGL